jgi:hypothetical protein
VVGGWWLVVERTPEEMKNEKFKMKNWETTKSTKGDFVRSQFLILHF